MTVTCFLTITNAIYAVLATLPRIAGHVWLPEHLLTTQFFILYAIIEYGTVYDRERPHSPDASSRNAPQRPAPGRRHTTGRTGLLQRRIENYTRYQ